MSRNIRTTDRIRTSMRAGEDETARNQTMLVLQVMYVGMYDAEKDFYDQFDARLAHIRSLLCMTE